MNTRKDVSLIDGHIDESNECIAGFCVECGEYASFNISSDKKVINHNDIEFGYEEVAVFCSKCGTKGYIPEINDENVERKLVAYDLAERSN